MKIKALTILAILILIIADSANAECAYFDFYGNLDSLPNIAHVRVRNSVIPSCSGTRGENCEYSFTAEVIEVLKGKLNSKTLHFSYDYWLGCPGVDTFENGENYIFAIKESESTGTAILNGVNCGSWGVTATEIEKVKEKIEEKLLDSGSPGDRDTSGERDTL